MPYAKNGPAWTDARIALLRHCQALGMTPRQMVTALGAFRSIAQGVEMITDKLKEIGLPVPAMTAVPVDRRVMRKPNFDPPSVPMAPECTDLAPGARCKQLVDLRDFHECHWPHGQPGHPGFFFCAADSIEGLPYCQFHSDLAYTPRRAAASVAA